MSFCKRDIIIQFAVHLYDCTLYERSLQLNCFHMKELLYAVRCLKSNEDMIRALAGQFKQLSHEPEKFI